MKTRDLLILCLLPLWAGWLFAQPAYLTRVWTGDLPNDAEKGWGCAMVDYDNNGLVDVYVATGWGATNWLYHNDGDFQFSRVMSETALHAVTDSGAGVWADYDNDGDLDLFQVNYEPLSDFFFINNPVDGSPRRFRRVIDGEWVNDTRLGQGAAWVDFNNDGHLDLLVANTGDQNEFLYQGDGASGMTPVTQGPLVNSAGRTQSAMWADFDNDGDSDLFLANSWSQRNHLFVNDGDGNFRKATGSPWDQDLGNSIGAAWADYDNDGDPDLFVGNGNYSAFLYRNDGDEVFTRVVEGPGASVSVHISPAWGDFDNDGYLDLFVGVGMGGSDLLFHSNRDGTFTQVYEGDVPNDSYTCGGAAWADFNNDGFLDLFVANGAYESDQPGEPDCLYRNEAKLHDNSNSWLLIRLVGTSSNRSAIGAKVRALATLWGKDVWQLQEVSGGGGHCSQDDLRVHFGFGDATAVDTLRIEWPSGIVQELKDVAANRILTVAEPPRLTPQAAGGFRIQCWIDQSFDVEASTDLENWTFVDAVTNEAGTLEFQDPEPAQHTCRYYRVVAN